MKKLIAAALLALGLMATSSVASDAPIPLCLPCDAGTN
jgi:hypothetical protein